MLKVHYQIENWDIPDGYLCPAIPGRADYVHYAADLLKEENKPASKIKCLDIGVGASCIYPIVGVIEYGWKFVCSEVDPRSIASARGLVELNHNLKGKIDIRLQTNQRSIFEGIVRPNEYFDLVICNPPFHESMKEAREGTKRKLSNLKQSKTEEVELNFGGQYNELCYSGGETQFIKNIIYESAKFKDSLGWITTLVSKESKLKSAQTTLSKVKAKNVQVIPMGQGNKQSRILAWNFKKTKPLSRKGQA